MPSTTPNDSFDYLNHLPVLAGPSAKKKFAFPPLSDSDDENSPGRVWDDDGAGSGNALESPSTSQSVLGNGSGEDDDDGDGDDEDSTGGRGERGGNGYGIGEESGREYELRRNINRGAFKGSGFTDHDQTGDYDPEEESEEEGEMERMERGRKGKRDKGKGRARARKSGGGSDGVDVDVDGEVAGGSQHGDDDDDDDGLDAMGDLGIGGISPAQDDGEEDEPSDIDADHPDAEVDATGDADAGAAPASKVTPKRKPRQARMPPRPQSCIFCTDHNLDCSLRESPASYPCVSCSDIGCGCILPTPYTTTQKLGTKKALSKQKAVEKKAAAEKAKKKEKAYREHEARIAEKKRLAEDLSKQRACTECRKDGKKCSHETQELDEITGGPCKRCKRHKWKCVVKAPRREESPPPEEERRPLPAGQRPLPGMFGSPAFDHANCAEEDEAAGLFNVSPDGQAKRKRTRKSRKKSKLSKELVAEVPPQDAYVLPPGFAKKQIKTSFAHPLLFNSPNIWDLSCDFHYTAFTIFGFPVSTHWVTYPSPPTLATPFQYTEIPGTGGHTETTRHTKTNICKPCTFARQKILFCKGHKLVGIRGLPKPQEYDFDGAYALLLSDQDQGFRCNTAARVQWCSVCPAPAFVECCEPPAHGGREEREEGCGLMLCEICAVALLTSPTVAAEGDGHGYGDAGVESAGVTEEEAKLEVASLIRDVKKLNLESRAISLIGGGHQAVPHRLRKSIPARRTLEEVIEEAKTAVDNGGGKNGKYMDGLRADVEFLSRNARGGLWEWMEWEAERRRQREWNGSGLGASVRRAPRRVVDGSGNGGGIGGVVDAGDGA